MNTIPRQPRSATFWLALAIFVASTIAGHRLAAQSPLFPNSQPIYYNPYGVGMYTSQYAQTYGRSFPFRQLPAAYSQPLPTPNNFQGFNYATQPGYGGSMYIRNYGNSNCYNPYGNGQ